MSARDSAYAALGLKPGALPVQVDEAYRRLIKQYHPDLTGGDGDRAAEINRAYTLLRRQGRALTPRRRTIPVRVRQKARTRRSSRMAWFVAIGGGALAITAATSDMSRLRHNSGRAVVIDWQPLEPAGIPTIASPLTNFDEPLHMPVIDGAIAEAVKLHSSSDGSGAEEYSRECQNRLRQQPNLAWFDACSAFDEATVTLTGDDSSEFNGSAVVSREMSAARALSDDVIGADSRLQKIRLRVELQLLPMLDSAASQPL